MNYQLSILYENIIQPLDLFVLSTSPIYLINTINIYILNLCRSSLFQAAFSYCDLPRISQLYHIILRLKCPSVNMGKKSQCFVRLSAVYGEKLGGVLHAWKNIIIIWGQQYL